MKTSLPWSVAIALFTLVLAGLPAGRAADAPPGGLQSRVFTDAEGKTHPFVIFIPAPAANPAGSKPPVMLFLHGSGERGANNLDQVMAGIGPALWKRKAKFPFVVVMPQCRAGASWQPENPDIAWALGMLRQVQAEFGTDPDRVVLTGLSMGGAGTWALAAKDPSAWSAIVPMCARPEAATATTFAAARLPIWNFCGDKDQPATVAANRAMSEALAKAGAVARYTEYPGVPHNCWDNAYGTDELFTWMLAQARSKNAAR
jgi:predicted peptidase